MVVDTELLPSAAAAASPVTPIADRCLYLLGRPTLKQWIRFAREEGKAPLATGAAVDRWNAARALIEARTRTEAGIADAPETIKLGPSYRPLLTQFLKDPLIRHGFNTLPTEVVLVPLDRLVVWQHHIDLSHVERLVATIGPGRSGEELFPICLPFEHPTPPVVWDAVSSKKFVFRSPSNDLRFLGTMSLEAANIQDHPPPGALVGVVGLAVGFGSNFLNAIQAEGRLILHNGSHRAYALRQLGYTHVPCIVQHVGSREELTLVASDQVRKHPEEHLTAPRPPILPDYFDPDLQATLEVHRRARQITVRFEVEEEFVPTP